MLTGFPMAAFRRTACSAVLAQGRVCRRRASDMMDSLPKRHVQGCPDLVLHGQDMPRPSLMV